VSRRPRELPFPLSERAFTAGEAQLAGVTRGRTRHVSLAAPSRGLRVHGIPASVEEAARAVALVLPAPWAYSHQTAARLLRLPVPVPWHPGEPLSVMRPSTSTRVRRRGVRGQRGLESRDVTSVRGLPVTGFVSAWCDLAGQLGLDDLVILGDAVLARRRVGLDAFTSAVEERRHGRWVTRIRRALPLLRVGSGSPMETRTRLVFARGGLPEPELNGDVFDDFGEWVARGDFVWRQARVVGEYEGDYHRTERRQWQHDIARTRILEDLGWRVVRITADDVRDPRRAAALVARLARWVGP